jgi:4-amino-4-deoxy-L-arabinose transferase-like glycosyltransferase
MLNNYKYYIMIISISTIIMYFSWVGFVSSDDSYYVSSGMGWLYDFPYIPNHFGNIRSSVGIPIAFMFAVFGLSEFSASLSSCIFLTSTALITYKFVSEIIGKNAAFVSSILMMTIPLFVVQATIPNADIPEFFYSISSFWLFWLACKRKKRVLLLFAGILAAFAFSAHEISAALLVFYGILFLIGFGLKRSDYFIIVGGFLLIIAIESSYYWIVIDDPIYRFRVLLNAIGNNINDRVAVGIMEFSDSGTLHIWDPIDPIIMFFTNHYFGLLGFLSLPAFYWGIVGNQQKYPQQLLLVRLLLLLGVVWFLVAAIELRNAKLMPRYYIVPAYTLFVSAMIWCFVKVYSVNKKSIYFGFIIFTIVNLGLISLENKNPRFGERALIDYMKISLGPIYTDPLTADKSWFFCKTAQVDCSRIISSPPVYGSVFFYNSANSGKPNRLMPLDKVGLYQINADWDVLWRKQPQRKIMSTILEKLGLLSFLPKMLISKIEGINNPVMVFKVSK